VSPGDPSSEEALRRLERVADRLRVVGPRLAGREGADAQRVLDEIRAGLQRLADLAADADGEPRRPVPVLAEHALGDQVLVLGHDLLGHDLLGRDLLGRDLLGHRLLARPEAVRTAAIQALDDVNRLI
jgi:hypothetical protein